MRERKSAKATKRTDPPPPPDTGSDEATALCPCKHTLTIMYIMSVIGGEGAPSQRSQPHLPIFVYVSVFVWLHEEE